jgi:hypothetical protein
MFVPQLQQTSWALLEHQTYTSLVDTLDTRQEVHLQRGGCQGCQCSLLLLLSEMVQLQKPFLQQGRGRLLHMQCTAAATTNERWSVLNSLVS